jgi:ParB family chromosome partitioning protein
VTSTMDLPTQRTADDPTPTSDADLTPSDLDSAAAEEAMSDDTDANPLAGLSEEELAALHAQWDAEINTVIFVDPHEVLVDENVRTDNAEADPATTANLKNHGVNTATNGYRNYETGNIFITEGQRRRNNACEAGVLLPVWMKTPPPADERKATIARIVTQLDENDVREPLTLRDTARALQQLTAFNLTPAGIARKLARGKNGTAYVKQVLQAGESELAVKAAERFDLDLVQAAVVAEFDNAGDRDTATELIRIAREAPNNFEVFTQSKRTERAEKQRLATLVRKLTRELTAAGVTIFGGSITVDAGEARSLDRLRPIPEDAPYTTLTAEDHASCPGHGAWIEDDHHDDEGNRVPVAVYGCAGFRTYGHALSHAPTGRADLTTHATGTPGSTAAGDSVATAGEKDEIAAARAALAADERARTEARIIRRWVIDHNKQIDASQAPRREWLAGFVLRKTAPKGAQLFLAKQKVHGGYELRRAFERNHALARELLGMPVGSMLADLTDKIAAAPTPGKATVYDMFLTLCAMEDTFSRNAWRYPQQSEQEYMAALISCGYGASDVERMVLAPQSEQDVIAAQIVQTTSTIVGDDGDAGDQPSDGSDSPTPDEDPAGDESDSEHIGAGNEPANGDLEAGDASDQGDGVAQETAVDAGDLADLDVADAELAGAAF